MNCYKVKAGYSKSQDYCKSPFRYPGGKFYALRFILPILDAVPHSSFYEPFVGGGSVFFGKKKVENNYINDLDEELINVYRTIQSDDEHNKLIELVECEIATRERHREVLNLNPSTYLSKAFKTYYLNRTSYSGIINKPAWGYALGASSPPKNWGIFILAAHKKLKDVTIDNADFQEYLLKIPKDGLAYIDPPYFLADQKRAYRKSFKTQDHLDLVEILKKAKFQFLLSYDDCSEVRNLYRWAHIVEREWFYNTANSTGKRKIGKEILVSNFSFVEREQFSLL